MAAVNREVERDHGFKFDLLSCLVRACWIFNPPPPFYCTLSFPMQLKLGVVLDTGDVSRGDVKIANRKGRIDALTRNIDELLEAGKVKSAEVPRIFGRLQFAEHQISGRVGKLAVRVLLADPAVSSAQVKLRNVRT